MLIYSQQALSKLWNKYGWDVILLSSFLFFFVLIVGIFLSKKFHSYLFGVSNVSQENNTINTKHVRESGNIDVNPFNRQSNRSFFLQRLLTLRLRRLRRSPKNLKNPLKVSRTPPLLFIIDKQ